MSKGSIKIARKYAKSLAELYQVSELDAAQEALKQFASLWKESKELREALNNPAFNINERIAASKEIASKVKPGDVKFTNFICLICESGRITEVELISEAFSSIVDQIKKLLSLKVTSAFDLSAEEKENFKNHINKEFGSLASVEWEKDPEIIGGLKIKAGDKVLDSSIKGALQRMESALLA